MIEGSSFHHIGIACKELSKSEGAYTSLGYARVSTFEDPGLGVSGVFLEGPGPRLELIADLPGERVVAPWLARDSAMYHLAYETADLRATLVAQTDQGAKVIRGPTPAIAFEGRMVAFVMLRNMALVEFISST